MHDDKLVYYDTQIQELEKALICWTKEINKRLIDLGLNKRVFINQALGLSKKEEGLFYSVMSGYINQPEVRQKIIAKIGELEAQQGQPPGVQPVIAGQVASGIEKQAV